MENEAVFLRNDLLERTAPIVDGNRRVIAICRLARAGSYGHAREEVLKRATFNACIQAMAEHRARTSQRRAPGGGVETVRQGVAH